MKSEIKNPMKQQEQSPALAWLTIIGTLAAFILMTYVMGKL